MSTTKVLIAGAAALALATAVYFFGGFFDVSANTPHGALSSTLLHSTMEASVARGAREIVVPEFTDDMARAGASDYVAMCADCHGAPGLEAVAFARGLNPLAPDLARSAEHLNPAELFWITRNGIRMTGMPAWSVTHADADLWPVVAFLTTLPGMTAQDYVRAVAEASGSGHHGVGHSHADSHSNQEHGETEAPAGAEPAATTLGGSASEDAHEHGEHDHNSTEAPQQADASVEQTPHAHGRHDH